MRTPGAKHTAVWLWVALGILGLVAIVGYETTLAVAKTAAWVEHTHEVMERLHSERAAFAEGQTLGRASRLTGDRRLLAAYEDAVRRVRENGDAVRALTLDNASQQERLNELEPLVGKRVSVWNAALDGHPGRVDPESDAMDAGRALDVRIFSILSDMVDEEIRLLAPRRHRSEADARNARLFQVGGTVISAMLLLTVFARLRREIARRLAAEQSARENEESLATTLLSIGDGVISTDTNGLVARINRVSEELTGWTAAEATGKPVTDVFRILHAETRATVPDPVEQALRKRTPVELESNVILVRRDGRELPIADSCAPVVDAKGTVHGAVLVFRDISLAVQAEALRDAAERQLIFSDRMVAVGTLAAGVAHEINNPLAYVVANLDMILEEVRALANGPLWGRMRELEDMAVLARQGADRVQKIVRGLKTFSRADEERRVVLDVRPVLELAINMAFNEIRHRARLVKDYGPVPLVEADEARLGQVFVNLLVNAAQATPEGDVATNEIRIVTSTDSAGRAVVEVRDTGPGIPSAVLGRVFDPFFTTKPLGVGTGLGLSICHSIITGMGGEIGVTSELGRGTTLRVVLRPSQGSLAVLSEDRETKPGAARAVVLIVDDERQVGGALARVLRDHEVTTVTRAQEALELIATGKQFDVIFSDVMMPEMSGMDLYDELIRRDSIAAERMVFITGGAFTPVAKAFLDRVPNARMEKPFDVKTVRALVQTIANTGPAGSRTPGP